MIKVKKLVVSIWIVFVFIALMFIIYDNRQERFEDADLNNIKNIIINERPATYYELKVNDVNNDKNITSLDYVIIRNSITK